MSKHHNKLFGIHDYPFNTVPTYPQEFQRAIYVRPCVPNFPTLTDMALQVYVPNSLPADVPTLYSNAASATTTLHDPNSTGLWDTVGFPLTGLDLNLWDNFGWSHGDTVAVVFNLNDGLCGIPAGSNYTIGFNPDNAYNGYPKGIMGANLNAQSYMDFIWNDNLSNGYVSFNGHSVLKTIALACTLGNAGDGEIYCSVNFQVQKINLTNFTAQLGRIDPHIKNNG